MHQGWLQSAHGDAGAAVCTVNSGLATFRATGAMLLQPHYLSLLAPVCSAAGDRTQALAVLAKALREANRTGERWLVPELYLAKPQMLADGRASMAEAQNLLSVAIETARALQLRGGISVPSVTSPGYGPSKATARRLTIS